ncbi:MAG: TetR/AcrR family transcriptional regulator [Candidatus Krumholzibacteriia bacterium]
MPRKGRYATTNEPFRPPLQARSRESHRRILEAAGELLDRQSFEAVTVAEIARRSKSSVGAFYARFEDKDALLEQLDGLCAEELAAAGRGDVVGLGAGAADLEERIEAAVGFYVGLYRRRAGVIRALRVRERGRMRTRFGERMKESERALLVAPVLAARRRVDHPDPQLASTLGALMVTRALEERILFPEMTESPTPITDAAFTKELARAYLAYLGVSASAAG